MDGHWPPVFRPLAVARDDNRPPQSPPTWREGTAETPSTLPGLMNLNFIYGLNPLAKPSESPSVSSMPPTATSTAGLAARANASPLTATSPNPDGAAMRRSGSNISSTSSDILVAPGLPLEPRRETPIDTMPKQTPLVNASVEHGRLLVIRLPPERLRGVLRRPPIKAQLSSNPSTPATAGKGGPNSRGTYSKEHTLKHPEISWVHRGQGRYLPASALKPESTSASARQSRFHQQSFDHEESLVDSSTLQFNGSPVKTNGTTASTPQSGTPGEGQPQKRRRRPVEETLKDSLTPAPVYGLRRRISLQKSPDVGEQRSARLARRSRGFSSFDSGRRYSRTSEYSETEADSVDEEDDNDEDDDSEDAYDSMDDAVVDKAYVDAHPEETFHHTGNSWYKRGKKSKNSKRSKARDCEDGIIKNSDGSFDFDRDKTIHESQLDKFPGCEFHHTGNGWYKAGPAASGKKTSIIIPYAKVAHEEEAGLEDENVKDASFSSDGVKEGVNGKYSKEYTLLHPEFDWVHRGKGRYVMRESSRDYTPASSVMAASTDRRPNEPTFDKAYVEAHPEEEFYHIGAGRWKRGIKPSRKSSSTREEMTAAASTANNRADSETLYDKAYVQAHPWLTFHHRGQGKYKMGAKEPRRQTLTAESSSPQSMPSFDESSFERAATESGGQGVGTSPEGLVTTEYVNSHPDQTFYHKGQGRWARGVPPPDSKQKTAVRGPGSKANGSSGLQSEDENELRGVPGLTALVLKSDGPDKFPDIQWNYRGGGKWSRITKQQFEEMTNPKQYRPATFSRKGRGRGVHDGSAAQLEREAAAADEEDQDVDGDDDYHGQGFAEEDRPAIKRRRRTKYGDYQVNEGFTGGSKASSKPQSKAPTPRPQLLRPEEDVLTEADVPDLYRGSHSPPDPDKDDDAAKLYRKVFPALNVEAILKSLAKHDPAVRPTENLKILAENAQSALVNLQDEYLSLERITAPHAKIPRKPAKGGRLPIDTQIFEDRKEADLYDYQYDGRRVGFQDPIAQKIIRDSEGRELRKRRQRHGPDGAGVLPGWDFGDGELSTKRASRQPTRFDGSAAPSVRRKPTTNHATPSVTPDRAATPANNASTNPPSQLPNGYEPPKTGRWAGHIPKRIRELRGESVGTVRSDTSSNSGGAEASQPANNSGEPKPVRKGRPPGSKNHHKRKDAGIKKGPRKKPMVLPVDGQNAAMGHIGNVLNAGPVATPVAPGVVPPDGGYAYPAPSAPLYSVGHAMNGGRF